MMWNDFTSLFTAYTGFAAIDVGWLTICKTAFVLKRTILTEEDKRMWQGVKMLIVDEISFIQDNQLQILDKRLKETRDSTQVCSGYSIIFAGDFRQLEPSGLSDNNPLYSRQSSNLWNDAMNAIILLDNNHRFKDNPEYGQIMMKRCGNTTYPKSGHNHCTQTLLVIMEWYCHQHRICFMPMLDLMSHWILSLSVLFLWSLGAVCTVQTDCHRLPILMFMIYWISVNQTGKHRHDFVYKV